MAFNNSFDNKNVLVTGHTGFKGSWLVAWLQALGANVTGIGLDPISNPAHYNLLKIIPSTKDLRIDIRSEQELVDAILGSQPDYLFHLAGQSLVRESYENPLGTWSTNVLGTLNILESLRKLKKNCVAILITSDKCYENKEWVWGYRETDELGGKDPYSASKASAELAIRAHVSSYFSNSSSSGVRIATARAGNVIGGGDWASDRIVPDIVRAWSNDIQVNIRNPNATRPWQHVLEPLSGYLSLASAMTRNDRLHGHAFNFGPSSIGSFSVLDVVRAMEKVWEGCKWSEGDVVGGEKPEAGLLQLNCDKALHYLDWSALLSFEEAIAFTAQWYKTFYEDKSLAFAKTEYQIAEFCNLAKLAKKGWAIK